MKTPFSRMLYGGDYNPNQWPREVWEEDMRLFQKAGINSATVNVFSWAKLQPNEGTYDFSELDDVIDMLGRENYDIVLATSTGAMPAWLVKNYPEVARVDFEGRRHKFGQRHNHCPNSAVYQKFAGKLVEELARRYGKNPHIACWHINNEYNTGCYCENCEKAFRIWLQKKYGTLEAVNAAWNTEFLATPSTSGTRLWPPAACPTAWALAGPAKPPLRASPSITTGSSQTACWKTTRWNGT